jgi:hypothetical protein
MGHHRRLTRAARRCAQWIAQQPDRRSWAARATTSDGYRFALGVLPVGEYRPPPRPRWARTFSRREWEEIWRKGAGEHRESLVLAALEPEARAAYLAARWSPNEP